MSGSWAVDVASDGSKVISAAFEGQAFMAVNTATNVVASESLTSTPNEINGRFLSPREHYGCRA